MCPWNLNYMKISNHATTYMHAAIILRFNCAIHLDKLLRKIHTDVEDQSDVLSSPVAPGSAV